MLRRHSSGTMKVTKKVKTLRRISANCPSGRSCNPLNNRPCSQFNRCLCFGIPFECLNLESSQISNANVHFRKDGSVYFTPSKYLQYSIVNSSRKGKTIIRMFRFKMRNKNRKSFVIQYVDEKGKLVSRRSTFKQANAGCTSGRKKRRK
ncbi:hypothetical protein [Longirhabdus pacifica]|uniref:hypothetical protein n=1 Tax=Longirhabdus pacifica TaxID=2305227 RepID=UPI0010091A99|nr:hypothetical protein [Longirhabdus pacifica]